MPDITEIQLILQNLLKRTVSQTEIARALERGRSNVNSRIKSRSLLTDNEIIKLENYFKVDLKNNNHERSPLYKKSLNILDSADEKELEVYYEMLKQMQKCIKLLKPLG